MVTVVVLLGALLSIVVATSVNNLLPLPREISWEGKGRRIISPGIQLSKNGQQFNGEQQRFTSDTSITEKAFSRTFDLVFKTKWFPLIYEPTTNTTQEPNSHEIVSVNIQIFNETDLQLGVDESYVLKVDDEITIDANTTWGVLNGFKTLQQLIIYEDGLFFIESSVTIVDSPIFSHRGVMIDTARNYMPVETIKQQLELMAYVKLNTFHWHIIDSQSWPIEVEPYPEMTKDAYSSHEVYTSENIKDIVDFAYLRGIRVIPEIDMPGHAFAGWKQIDARLVACGDCVWSEEIDGVGPIALEPPAGQLDLTYKKTFEVVRNVYNDIRKHFPDRVFHVGLDELSEACYLKSPAAIFFENNKTMNDLTQYWLDNALPILDKNRLTMWADVLIGKFAAHNLPKHTILQVWEGNGLEVKEITAAGYDVVVSPNSMYYLDCGSSGWVSNDPRYVEDLQNNEFNYGNSGSPCGPYKSWQRIYNFNIIANLTSKEREHVLGAEVAVWGEQIDSLTLTSKIWPRAAAIAESLWSGNRDPITGYYRTASFTSRILNFREYLVKLGYSVSAIMPKYCIKNPSSCDLQQDNALEKYGKFFY